MVAVVFVRMEVRPKENLGSEDVGSFFGDTGFPLIPEGAYEKTTAVPVVGSSSQGSAPTTRSRYC